MLKPDGNFRSILSFGLVCLEFYLWTGLERKNLTHMIDQNGKSILIDPPAPFPNSVTIGNKFRLSNSVRKILNVKTHIFQVSLDEGGANGVDCMCCFDLNLRLTVLCLLVGLFVLATCLVVKKSMMKAV